MAMKPARPFARRGPARRQRHRLPRPGRSQRLLEQLQVADAGDHAAEQQRLTFLTSWNNFLWPLVVATTEDRYTLPVALALHSVGQNQIYYGLLLAGAVVVVLPCSSSSWSCSATSCAGSRPPDSSKEPHMRRLLVPLVALVLIVSGSTAASGASPLTQYAKDTWRSMAAMTDPRTGLVADNIAGDLSTPSAYTSPTNIGGYLWSAVVARDLGIISKSQARRRVSQTLDTLAGLRHHTPSGMFYNWYDPRDGSVVTVWPEDGSTVTPFLSSVDNGWLAAALRVVAGAMPELRAQADRILGPMNFGFYYNPAAVSPIGTRGLIRGGFWDTQPPGCSVAQNGVWFTCNHYDITVTEPRIATYLGIGAGQIPPTAYFDTMRTLPDNCDYSWQEMQPHGFDTAHLGVSVYEGSYRYRGIMFVPSWGGDMFEALMPDLFVPEERWGPRSWGRNHPATVAAQIEHGLNDAKYGYWGFSPASNPSGGYSVWGVDAMGMDTNGYPSDVEGSSYDAGFGDCRPAGPAPSYGDGVVTPHAAFLALPYAKGPVLANLAKLRKNFDAYGPGGFYDAVAVGSGTVARRYLSLDQAMIMGAIGNALADDVLRRAFVTPQFEQAVRPLLAQETFNVPARQDLPQLREVRG